MKITDEVGGIHIEVGNPSKNHISLYEGTPYDEGGVTIQRAYWEELKKKIDKMFEVAENM
jgi:hypothetical protein